MYDIALVLSIISSILIIIYLIGLIFRKPKDDKDLTITISGRIVTTTVTNTEESMQKMPHSSNNQGNVIDGEIVDSKALQSQIANILKNVKH